MIRVNPSMFGEGQTVLIRECDFSTAQFDDLISRSSLDPAKFKVDSLVEQKDAAESPMQGKSGLFPSTHLQNKTNIKKIKTSNTGSPEEPKKKCINLVVIRNDEPELKKETNEKKDGKQNSKGTNALCSMCGKNFTTKYNLKRHMMGCKECPEEEKGPRFSCSCGRTYSQEWDLRKHKPQCQETDIKFKSCMFPMCNLLFYHRAQLLSHMKAAHNISVREPEVFHFESFDDFKVWKEKLEEETYTYYSKQTGSNVTGVSVNTYYVCQHDGSDRSHSSSPRKTLRRNKKGRVKTGRFCWSQMNVKEYRNGSVRVTYHSSHTHPVTASDTEHHPLPSSITSEIQRRLMDMKDDEEEGETHEFKKSRKRGHATNDRALRALARKNRKLFRITAEAVGGEDVLVPVQEEMKLEVAPTLEQVLPEEEEPDPISLTTQDICLSYCDHLKEILSSGKVEESSLRQIQNTLATLIDSFRTEEEDPLYAVDASQMKVEQVAVDFSNENENSMAASQITFLDVGDKIDGSNIQLQSDGKTVYRVLTVAPNEEQTNASEDDQLYQNAVEYAGPREFIIIDHAQIFQSIGGNQLTLASNLPTQLPQQLWTSKK